MSSIASGQPASEAGSKDLHPCVVCKQSASQACAGCTDPINPGKTQLRTWYCSRECQTKDWADHKPVCNHRNALKRLYRAAYLIQAVFYIFCEFAYEANITASQMEGDRFVVHMKDLIPEPAFYPFPDFVVQSQEHKEALLTFFAGSARLLARLHTFIRDLLKESCSSVDIVTVKLKNSCCRIDHHYEGGSPGLNDRLNSQSSTQHILRVSLNSKLAPEYALDPASAHHGYSHPIQEYESLCQDRVDSIEDISGYTNFFNDTGDTSYCGRANREVSRCVHHAITRWLNAENLSISRFLRLKGDVFSQKKTEMLAEVVEKFEPYCLFIKKMSIPPAPAEYVIYYDSFAKRPLTLAQVKAMKIGPEYEKTSTTVITDEHGTLVDFYDNYDCAVTHKSDRHDTETDDEKRLRYFARLFSNLRSSR